MDEKIMIDLLKTVLFIGSFFIVIYIIDRIFFNSSDLSDTPSNDADIPGDQSIITENNNATPEGDQPIITETPDNTEPPTSTPYPRKLIYNKYDQIILPEEKKLCFDGSDPADHLMGYDQCMACQVDMRDDMMPHIEGTNVILSCLYSSDDPSNKNPSLRDKNKCLDKCVGLKDLE